MFIFVLKGPALKMIIIYHLKNINIILTLREYIQNIIFPILSLLHSINAYIFSTYNIIRRTRHENVQYKNNIFSIY